MKLFNSKITLLDNPQNKDFSRKTLFLETCNLVKKQREKYGISIEMLSKKTKISAMVLESIENGNDKDLPEKTYLKQMLKAIESELGLPENKLEIILEETQDTTDRNNIKIFTPVNINVFSSWEGSIIYLILMFTSIILLNKYQNLLAGKNVFNIKPLNQEEVIYDNKKISPKE